MTTRSSRSTTGRASRPSPATITDAAEGNGIDGEQAAWKPATFDLSAYAGKTIGLRVRYSTDGAAQGQNPDEPSGIFVDAIKLTNGATVLLEDGAETGANGWTLDGFSAVEASSSADYPWFYIASNREYVVVRQVPQDGPVQLRVPQPARLRGALPVPGRPAHLPVGHLAGRQQHEPAPR